MKVLVLGGTGEARSIADRLAAMPGQLVITSLAGRVSNPRLPAGEVRIGGFGGPAGLAEWLRAERVDLVIDATHPFAARITANAVEAAAACGLPLLLVRRPAWTPVPGDDWRRVPSLASAASGLADLDAARAFLTIGRQGLAHFADLETPWFLIRCVEPPEPPLPARAEVVLSRGPFTVTGELDLMRRRRIDVLVTKNSGGRAAVAKLAAARELGMPVVMVSRPPVPPDVPAVASVDAAIAWFRALLNG